MSWGPIKRLFFKDEGWFKRAQVICIRAKIRVTPHNLIFMAYYIVKKTDSTQFDQSKMATKQAKYSEKIKKHFQEFNFLNLFTCIWSFGKSD